MKTFQLNIAFFLLVILFTCAHNTIQAQGCMGCMSSPRASNDPVFTSICAGYSSVFNSDLMACDSINSGANGYFYLIDRFISGDYDISDNSPGGGVTNFYLGHIDTSAFKNVYSVSLILDSGKTYCFDPYLMELNNSRTAEVKLIISNNSFDSVMYWNLINIYGQSDSVAAQYTANVTDTFEFSIRIKNNNIYGLNFILDDVFIREVYTLPGGISISSAQTIVSGINNTLYTQSGYSQYYWYRNGVVFDTTITDSLTIIPDSTSAYYYVIVKDGQGCPGASNILPGVIISPGSGTCDCFIHPNLIQDGDFSQSPNIPANCAGFDWLWGMSPTIISQGSQLPHGSTSPFFSLQTPGILPCSLPPTVAGNQSYYVLATQLNLIGSWLITDPVSTGVFIGDVAGHTGNFEEFWFQEINITSAGDYCFSGDAAFISYDYYQQNPPLGGYLTPWVDVVISEVQPVPSGPVVISGPISVSNSSWHNFNGSVHLTPGTYRIAFRAFDYALNISRGNDIAIDNIRFGTNSMTGAQISPTSIFVCENTCIPLVETGSNPGLGYNWYSTPSGLSSSSNAVIVCPSATTTYTVEVGYPSNSSCFDDASIVVQTYVPNVTIITKGDFICTSTTKILNALYSGPVPGLSYAWQLDNIPVGTNSAYLTISTGGTYSVTITDLYGCSATGSVYISEENCCNNAEHFIPGGSTITSSTVVANNAVIQGIVTISGIVNWAGKNIFMGPGARIDIPVSTGSSIHQLVISNSTLRADCQDMWQGIKILGDINATTPSGGLIVTNKSLIRDAIEAVRSEDNAPFLLLNSTFDLNHVHVDVEDFTGGAPGWTHFGNISGCTFECSGVMQLAPHAGERTYMGVFINNSVFTGIRFLLDNQVTNYPTYSTSSSVNIFRNADIGINVQNTNIEIADASFRDFLCVPVYSNPCVLSYGHFSRAIHVESRGGIAYIHDNKFTNCHIGIFAALNEAIRVYNNEFSDIELFGVWGHMNPGPFSNTANLNVFSNIFANKMYQYEKTAAIRYTYNRGICRADDNDIDDFYAGVVTDMNSNNQVGVSISENNIVNDVNGHPTYGIYSKELGLYSTDIRANLITSRAVGIHTLGTHSRLRILENEVTMLENFQSNGAMIVYRPNIGLLMEGTKASFVKQNLFQGNALLTLMTGIHMDKITDGGFCTNTIQGARYDVEVSSSNFFSQLIDNDFHSASRHAILFSNNGNTGNQGFAFGNYVYNNKNRFHCGFTSTLHANNSYVYNPNINVPQSRIYGYASGALDPCGCLTPCQSSSIGMLVPCSNNEIPCVQYPSGALFLMDNELICGVRMDYMARVHDDSVPNLEFEHEWLPDQIGQLHGIYTGLNTVSDLNRWVAQLQAYQILRGQDSVLSVDSLLTVFVDSVEGTGIHTWMKILDSISAGNIDSAKSLLDNWNTDYSFEEELKTVMQIQMDMILDARVLPDSIEQSILSDIASNCPDSSYLSVHLARGILMFSDETEYFNNCELDTLLEDDFWYYDSIQGTPAGDLTLYPNPADEDLTVEVNASVEGYRQIYLLDNSGHILDVQEIEIEETSLDIDVSGYAQGIYLISLFVDNTFRESKILLIQRD